MSYTDSSPNRRDVSPVFMALPDKKLFPDYYAVIPEPICLHTINVSARLPYVIHRPTPICPPESSQEEPVQDARRLFERRGSGFPQCTVLYASTVASQRSASSDAFFWNRQQGKIRDSQGRRHAGSEHLRHISLVKAWQLTDDLPLSETSLLHLPSADIERHSSRSDR